MQPTGVMHFVGGTDQGYILSNKDTGLNALYKYDFGTRTMGEKVFACPTNDVEGSGIRHGGSFRWSVSTLHG